MATEFTLTHYLMRQVFNALSKGKEELAVTLAILATYGVKPEQLDHPAASAMLGFIMERGTDITAFELQQSIPQEAKAYLGEVLATPLESSKGIVHYCNRLNEDYAQRKAAQFVTDLQNALPFLSAKETCQALAEAMIELQSLLETAGDSSVVSMKEAVSQAKDQVNAWEAGDHQSLSTGFKCLDDAHIFLPRGQMSIIVAPTGVGKSALVQHIAKHNAMNGQTIAYLGLEMAAFEVTLRMASAAMGVNQNHLRYGQADSTQYEDYRDILDKHSHLPMTFNRQMDLTIADIAMHMQATKALMGRVDLVIIDYARLVNSKGANEQQKAESLGRDFKLLSLFKNDDGSQPVILVVWDMPKVDSTRAFLPTKSSIMYGGEKAAGLILGLTFPKEYQLTHQAEIRRIASRLGYSDMQIEDYWLGNDPNQDCKGHAWLVVAKNRMGTDGLIVDRLRYNGQFTRWYEV